MAIEEFQPNKPLSAPARPARQQPPQPAPGDVYRLDLILRDLLRNWYLILAGGALGLFMALGIGALKGPSYTATMIVSPIIDDPLNKVQFYGSSYSFADSSPVLGRFGGNQPNEFDQFIVLLNSHRVAEVLEEEHQVSRIFFSSLWDEERETWRRPDGLRFLVKNAARRLFGYPDWQPPQSKDVQAYLQDNLKISPVSGGAMRAISLSGSEPEHLARVLSWLFVKTSTLLRDERNAALRANIAYLQERIGQSRIDIYRDSLISLLSDQERELMLSQTEQPFGAVLLEPPTRPRAPSGPEPLLLIAALVLAGLLLTSLCVLGVTLPRRRMAAEDRQAAQPSTRDT